MAQPEIILYDLPSKSVGCWSPNPWKTRMALNYKKINYKTEWVEYPDVEPKFKALGLPPNEMNGNKHLYSIPTIQIVKTGEYIMDSKKIIPVLEKLYPEPSLHLDEPVVEQLSTWFPRVTGNQPGNFIAKVPRQLPERSAEYFERTRKEALGMSLSEATVKMGGDELYQQSKPTIQEAIDLLQKNEGPFLLGNEICYGDMYILCLLQWMVKTNPEMLEKFYRDYPILKRLYDAGAEKGVFADDGLAA